MCGIIGLFAFGDLESKQEEIRQEAMIYLSTELLQLTQSRGKDATGISVLFKDCKYMGLKMGVSAVEFISRFGKKETDYEGFMKVWRKKQAPAKVFIGHCRKPSVGKSTINNVNNHPIKVGDIVGVHNGTLDNHALIHKNLNRKADGDVDSEAIFQLLHHFTNNGADPFTLDTLDETCKRLEGTYACLAFNGNNPFQVVAFRDARPIKLTLIKSLKLVIASSDDDFIKTALFRFNIAANVYNNGVNFPTIHKDDIDTDTLEDDTAFLFDLTRQIDAKSSLTSLYDKQKIVHSDKIWKSKNANAYPYNRNNGIYSPQQYNNNNINKTEVNAAASKKPDNNLNKTTDNMPKCNTATAKRTEELVKKHAQTIPIGVLVWDDTSSSFKPADVTSPIKTENINDLSNMFINMETEKVSIFGKVIRPAKNNLGNDTIITNEPKHVFLLNETTLPFSDKNEIQAQIDVIDVVQKEDEDELEKNAHLESMRHERVSNTFSIKKQIDMSALEPIGVELSVEAANSIQRFSSSEEVCQVLSVHDNKNLENLPIYSLANRIIKCTTKKAFLSGWKAAIEKSDKLKNLLITDVKKKKAEQTIRTSKTLIEIISNSAIYTKNWISTKDLHEQITIALANNKEINSRLLLDIFSAGDLRKNNVLKRIQTLLINNEK